MFGKFASKSYQMTPPGVRTGSHPYGTKGLKLTSLSRGGDSKDPSIAKEGQPYLFQYSASTAHLDARLWHGSFNAKESSLQQLAPYVGKLKTGMVRVLLDVYTKQGEYVLDPFSGSGVVPLEALLAGRKALANDLSP